MTNYELAIEIIGWSSTVIFLVSIVVNQRTHLHELGMLTSVATGIYGYAYGATAIWVKWAIAFVFHFYMWQKIKRSRNEEG
jgi:hypothetical protein